VEPPRPNPTADARRTILIVDDDAASRDLLARWFQDGGWAVRVATTCAEALSVAAVAPPDRCIIEQGLPDGSGLDLFPRLRALGPGLSGVVLTRYPSIAAAVHAIRTGFADYLAKPIDWVHLAALFGIGLPVGWALPAANDTTEDASEPHTLARVQWEHIQAVLFSCCGNVSEAARILGLHRRSLQRKLRRLPPP